MKNPNPLYSLRFITGMVLVLTGTLPIVALIEREKIASEFIFLLMFLGISLYLICRILKSIDKRLSDIEAKTNKSDA